MEKQYQEQGEGEGLLFSKAITSTELRDRLLRFQVSSFGSITFCFLPHGQVGAVKSPWEHPVGMVRKEHSNHKVSVGGRGNQAYFNIWYWTLNSCTKVQMLTVGVQRSPTEQTQTFPSLPSAAWTCAYGRSC